MKFHTPCDTDVCGRGGSFASRAAFCCSAWWTVTRFSATLNASSIDSLWRCDRRRASALWSPRSTACCGVRQPSRTAAANPGSYVTSDSESPGRWAGTGRAGAVLWVGALRQAGVGRRDGSAASGVISGGGRASEGAIPGLASAPAWGRLWTGNPFLMPRASSMLMTPSRTE